MEGDESFDCKMSRMTRQKPFLQGLLREAKKHRRDEMLQMANSDQINALSELSLNLLKNNIPVSSAVVRKLKPHKVLLRELAKRRQSVKARKELSFVKKVVRFGKD